MTSSSPHYTSCTSQSLVLTTSLESTSTMVCVFHPTSPTQRTLCVCLTGRSCDFAITFKKGGATDFTRLFFRLAQGTCAHAQRSYCNVKYCAGELQQSPPERGMIGLYTVRICMCIVDVVALTARPQDTDIRQETVTEDKKNR